MTATGGARTATGLPDGIVLRQATTDDIAVCAEIWRVAINDYIVPMNQPEIPDDLAPIQRLYAHLLSTDGERFVVATREERVVAFGIATRRDDVWFLSMLFVRPGEQGSGLGRAILAAIMPADGDDPALGTATDSGQPISNALYASLGIVPRMPLLSLVGRPRAPEPFGELPSGVTPVPFEAIAAGPPDGDGHRELVRTIDTLDRELAGFAHPQDHRWLRNPDRRGFLYRGPDGAALGYGYASLVGRVGPVAVRDEALLGPVVGHLLHAVEPRDASALWIPGHADRALVPLLRAGLRLEAFPLLLCWSRPFADFHRYLPISPGLL